MRFCEWVKSGSRISAEFKDEWNDAECNSEKNFLCRRSCLREDTPAESDGKEHNGKENSVFNKVAGSALGLVVVALVAALWKLRSLQREQV